MLPQICLVLAALAFCLLIFLQISPDFGQSIVVSVQKPKDPEEELFSTCILAEFGDGWTRDLLRISHVNMNPVKKCDENFKPMTNLDGQGRLVIRQDLEEIECRARSIGYLSDKEVMYGNWTGLSHHPSERFRAEFVQARCFARNGTLVEDFIHIQVVKKKASSMKNPPPSVYIFVIDSVASSQALRSLPKTVSLLKHEFDAVNLRHVNKVGENSHPAGMALFFGKLISHLDRGVFNLSNVKPDWIKEEHCYRFLDDHGFILSNFTRRGYVSLMAEDWASGVFNYPNCWGFSSPPVTHYMRPFQLAYDDHERVSRKFQGRKQCLESHTFLYKYLADFMLKYPTAPKIALTWASNVAHNDADRLFHFDSQLFTFFRKHRADFDDAYVFFLGDHGIRFGSTRNTAIGTREVNNPMLFVSVPRRLRPSLVPILQENAEKLLTPFDIHASFTDILHGIEKEWGPEGLRGDSLFRRLPAGERSCRTLPIPLRYCLCEWNRTLVEEEQERRDLGEAATALLNQKLRIEKITDYCKDFEYAGSGKVFSLDGTRGIHSVHFHTQQCGAEFKAMLRVENVNDSRSVSLVSDDFTRTNAYGKSAECLNWNADFRSSIEEQATRAGIIPGTFEYFAWRHEQTDRWLSELEAAQAANRQRFPPDTERELFIRDLREQNENPAPLISRSCRVCTLQSPHKRVVYTVCGHLSCRVCALIRVGEATEKNVKMECPICEKESDFVPLFEDPIDEIDI